MKERMKRLYWRVAMKQLEGVGVIEVILILVIIIGLVLIFRNEITDIIQNAFSTITDNSAEINKDITLTQ